MNANYVMKKMIEGAIPKVGEMLVVGAFALGGQILHQTFRNGIKKHNDAPVNEVQMFDLKEEA